MRIRTRWQSADTRNTQPALPQERAMAVGTAGHLVLDPEGRPQDLAEILFHVTSCLRGTVR